MNWASLVLHVALVSGTVALVGMAACLYGWSSWTQGRPSAHEHEGYELGANEGTKVMVEGLVKPSPWLGRLIAVIRLALWIFQGSIILLLAIESICVFSLAV